MKRFSLLLVVLVTGVLTGCASGPTINRPAGQSAMANEMAGAPKWVLASCAKYMGKKVICAAGSAGGTRNVSLARSSAEADGRAKIAQILNAHMKSSVKNYARSVTGGAEFGKAADDEQLLENTVKQISEAVLAGVSMEETWISSSGTFYALMAVSAEDYRSQIAGMKQLSEATKNAVIRDADKAFEELDNATARP